MIARLKGILEELGLDHAVVDVNGVGYLVYASARTLRALGNIGSPVALFIETHVREDHINLYGFSTAAEKEWFRLLCTVQGVGAKVAQGILSTVPPETLPVAIAAQDTAVLTRADGVGPKLATRIVTELKEKAGKIALGQAVHQKDTVAAKPAKGKKPGVVETPVHITISGDAVSALINLGYGRAEAFGAVANVMRQLGDTAEVSAVIRESLKELSA